MDIKEKHEAICRALTDICVRKNHDYGDVPRTGDYLGGDADFRQGKPLKKPVREAGRSAQGCGRIHSRHAFRHRKLLHFDLDGVSQ